MGEEQEQQEQEQSVLGDNTNTNTNTSSSGKATARLPRWTRQEILVLIEGKRVAETRVRRGRTAAMNITMMEGSNTAVTLEPKWATVSKYCKRHGVNRGPVQCRKRWSNLSGDFKKIKDWESRVQDESDSFWVMRNDLRRDRKLPGFFDKEVFDILDGPCPSSVGPPDSEADPEAVFDSARTAPADDALFSDDFDHETDPVINKEDDASQQQQQQQQQQHPPSPVPIIASPTPLSEKQYQPFTAAGGTASEPTGGSSEQQAPLDPELASTSHEGRKRRRFMAEDDAEPEREPDEEGGGQRASNSQLNDQLIQVLERNGRILSAQLEAHNINLKLDREDRKDHSTSLVAVLNKVADALGRIADKL